ncbi:DNA mismatch repair protein Mlh3-like isoform X3 [Choristoneura fumiferana]|uniref:DNA mismatch repair protein Mlh3-like isoform X3 n=1 Tax=Choristoneura fumiferana TaxID=7141 RepID=UPI003D1591E8
MVLKRLPLDVQSILSASTQIKTFLTAVEELVYNAFDANSTSIAVRVNIQENYIQVVDNGHGVNKDDFHLLGQRYTTSRYKDSITSKSIQKYGHSGQSLANIIKISQSVKITSHCKGSEETWLKHFYNGKVNECIMTQARPSVGTTVEIEGFLYNLTIQKKGINALQELQRIKKFLQQMSLVHCNASLSLRDNSENEIIFKIHKNRDIYQTLTLVLGIEKSNLLELQVEKNQYKVTGFVQKQDSDSHGFQWIFVNKKFIEKSDLHKIINQNIVKKLPQKKVTMTKNRNNEEEKMPINNKVPDYFIFITCQHNEYEILSNPKQSMLEFKNCSQINKLLEKLMQFYNGDISLTKKTTVEKSVEREKTETNNKNTRNEVKIIIDKILGSHHKKINGSQLHNGVKGKMIKRKIKKKVDNNSKLSSNLNLKDDTNKITRKLKSVTSLTEQNEKPVININNNKIKDNCTFQIPKKKQIKNKALMNTNKEQGLLKEITPQETKHVIVTKDPIISKFEKETGEVQKRCQILSKKVDNWCFKRKRKCKVFTNEYVQYSTVIRDSKKMTIRKKIDEVIIHEYLPLPQKTKTTKYDCNNVMKSDDLLRPVAVTFEQNNVQDNELCANILKQKAKDYNGLWSRPCALNIPRLTYESHCYTKDAKVHYTRHEVLEDVIDNNRRFISHVSRDNFLSPKKRKKETRDEHLPVSTNKHIIAKKSIFVKSRNYNQADGSTYSIQFSETGSKLHETPNITPIPSDITPANNKANIGSTYTIIDSDKPTINDAAPKMNIENAVSSCYFPEAYSVEVLHDSREYCIDQSINYSNALVNNLKPGICEKFRVKAQKRNYNTEQYFKLRDIPEVDGTTKICETYCIQASLSYANKYYTDKPPEIQEFQDSLNRNTSPNFQGANNLDVIFISNSQRSNTEINEMNIHTDIDPLRICETIFDDQDNEDNDKYNFIFNSVNDITNEHNDVKLSDLCETEHYSKQDVNEEMNLDCNAVELNYFNLKNRRRFVPKGMSPIFENCNTRGTCHYEFGKDYYEEVLGQVDYKFIATKIKGKSKGQYDYLVLFDQHAVDERIRLEKNMAEYFDGDQWKRVTLDGVSLKLTRDEILYLHNNKKKFHKLGLEWNILDSTDISVTAIPEAILGKNARRVETVLKAVKSLIKEEINMIKEQGGCVSLYPKSIMDLVFSEACRFAIMFGDALSKADCVGLLDALSECKTPFQCAHGRPVMAVLMDIRTEKREYKVDFKGIQRFRKMQNLIK